MKRSTKKSAGTQVKSRKAYRKAFTSKPRTALSWAWSRSLGRLATANGWRSLGESSLQLPTLLKERWQGWWR
jgi:hypothetical protein